MFVSKKKNLRKKVGDESVAGTISESSTAIKPKAVLSFADDEEEDGPQSMSMFPARSKKKFGTGFGDGHKVAGKSSKSKPMAVPEASVAAYHSSSAGEYTKEKLAELAKNTKTVGGGRMLPPPDPKREPEPLIVLKGTLKPSSSTQTSTALASMDEKLGDFKLDQQGSAPTFIPDAAAIAAAKAKRERLRAVQSAPDYISLSGGVKDSEQGSGSSDSDDGDENARISFVGKPKNQPGTAGSDPTTREVPGRFQEAAGGEDEEDDEETLMWQEAQIRKGVGKRQEGSEKVLEPPTRLEPAGVQRWKVPEGATALERGNAVMRSLLDGAQRLKEAYESSLQQSRQANSSLALAAESVLSLESALQTAGEKYRYVQELKDYVSNLCDFLKDKAALIEELEEEMLTVHADRATLGASRREADESDELAEAECAVSVAMAAMGRGAGISAASQLAARAIQEIREGTQVPPQLDEFGRDVNLQRRMEAKRRFESREKRKAMAAAKTQSRGNSSINGTQSSAAMDCQVSSGEESESEREAYTNRRQQILTTAAAIFKDASDDYCQLARVKSRLEEWKQKYPETYRDSYCSLSVPALLAPFVRLELLQWEPLYSTPGFDTMAWYTLLFDFGIPSGKFEEADPNDPDTNLIPVLVQKVALPLLQHYITKCWEPASSSGTKRAVEAVKELLVYVPAQTEAMKNLLLTVHDRLAESVEGARVPAWAPAVLSVVPMAGQLASSRFRKAVILLENMASWQDVLAPERISQLAFDRLVVNQLLPHLRAVIPTLQVAVERSELATGALLKGWVSLEPSRTNPKLEPFLSYLGVLSKSIQSKKSFGAHGEDITGLARRVKVMMSQLGDHDRARATALAFRI